MASKTWTQRYSWFNTSTREASQCTSSSSSTIEGYTTARVTNSVATGGGVRNWRKRLGKAQCTTDLSAKITEITPGGPRSLRVRLLNSSCAIPKRYEVKGQIVGREIIPTSNSYLIAPVNTRARIRFLQKYRSARTAFQGGVFFGELREAVRMLARPGKALRSGIDNYVRDARAIAKKAGAGRSPARTRSANRAISETWLEYVYGWRPLIADIRDAGRLVNVCPHAHTQPIFVIETSDGKSVGGGLTLTHFSSYGIRERAFFEHELAVMFRGGVRASTNPNFAEQAGFSWSNFAPTVWNLIPYSFLVDYFTNIGNVIDAASLGRCSLVWGAVTTVRRDSCRKEFYQHSPPPSSVVSVTGLGPSSYSAVRREIERKPITSVAVGISDTQFRIPGMGSSKWINILALGRARRAF